VVVCRARRQHDSGLHRDHICAVYTPPRQLDAIVETFVLESSDTH
jgi:hypothetical protein